MRSRNLFLALGFTTIFLASIAGAQTVTLQEQLNAQYKLVKMDRTPAVIR